MKAYEWIDALGIPDAALVGRRIPKTLLVERGAVASGDKRQIREGLEGLDWVAALKPTNIGVPELRDAVREVLEIAVLVAFFRPGAKAARITELIHRAVPYLVWLVTEQDDAIEISLAHKREAQNEAGKIVLDGTPLVTSLAAHDADTLAAFRASLTIAAQPRAHLLALYEGWCARVEALNAAAVTHRFALAASPEAAQARRTALAEHARLASEIAMLRAQAERETQLARRVELNLALQRLEAERAAAAARL